MARLLDLLFRRGTAAGWAAVNPVLHAGEPGWESDTRRLKIGDGVTAWSGLGYEARMSDLYVPASTAIAKTQLAITAGTPGWRVFTSQAPLAYSRSADGLVTLEGYLQPAVAATVAGTSYTIATLPAGCRPLDGPEFFPSMAYPTSTTTAAINTRISVDGGGLLRIFTPVAVPQSAGVTVTGSFMAQA